MDEHTADHKRGFEKIHHIMTKGKSTINPKTAQLQSELLTAKMDVEELKSLLTSKDKELGRIASIIENIRTEDACCVMSGEFIGAYAAIKSKLVSELTLLKGVKAADGNLNINHYIEFTTAVMESLDLMLGLAKKCASVEKMAQIKQEITNTLKTLP
jgi:hypothetical protein